MSKTENLLYTVNRAAKVLLTANVEDTMDALMEGMEIVGRSLNVDRVQIWRNENINDELHFVMRYEWLSELGKQLIEVPIGLSCPYSARPEWYEMFMRGEYINSPISQLPPEDAVFLGYYEMKAIVIQPLFLHQEFIGFFSVDDCRNERVFSDEEMDMLASAGLMFANVFNRNLQEQQITDALTQALAASRAKSDFLATMSHEMRTPMNAIIGMTAIAKKTDDRNRKNYALDRVSEAANHLLGIINSVLDLSKIEANKMELQNNDFDLHKLLRRVVTLVQHRIDAKHHRFSLNVSDTMPQFFNGDSQKLTQIIVNLLSNAVIYTPDNGMISLSVDLQSEKAKYCVLRFEVKDSGPGISPESQEVLFNMFEQGDNSMSRKFGGTGLGLTISKRLTELMGGAIVVESQVGVGSNFTFTVKLKKIDGIIAEKVDNDMRSKHGIVYKFPGKKLLVAEDEPINREIIINLLDETELTIDIAKNGEEAYRMIVDKPGYYDMVFMDMRMPEVNGLEATIKIREIADEYAKNLPIIAMTANVFIDDIEKCLEAGMNDHVGKPIDIDVVFDKLHKYLGK